MWPFKKKAAQGERPSGRGVHDPVLKALAPWIERHVRTAWRPVLGDAAATGRVSQFGGAPWLRPGEAAPVCAGCGKPIDLFLQLDGRETPVGSPWSGAAVLQVFYCRACDVDHEGWEPFSKAHLLRAVPAADLTPPTPAAAAAAAIVRKAITGWEAFRDAPHPEEQEALGLSLDYDFKARRVTVECPEFGVRFEGLDCDAADEAGKEIAEAIGMAADGDKLGGWPAWVQGAEYPSCPRCSETMRHVFQIESEEGVDYMFGDLGCAHVTQCAAHPDVFAFGWACH